jgi:hypothetical protein
MSIILGTGEEEVRGIVVQGQPRQKFHENPSQQKGEVVCTCHSSYTGSTDRRITVQASLVINVRPIFKKIKEKRARGMAQVVE